MNAHTPSALSLAGAGFYLVVAAASVLAARQSTVGGHGFSLRRCWFVAAAFFILFAGLRLVAAEDLLRALFREGLAGLDLNDVRRSIQLPLSLVAIIGGAALATASLQRISRRGAASSAAALEWMRLAIAGMIALIMLRLISLHSIDKFLFAPTLGPVRINWLFDLGLSTIALIAALRFARQPNSN